MTTQVISLFAVPFSFAVGSFLIWHEFGRLWARWGWETIQLLIAFYVQGILMFLGIQMAGRIRPALSEPKMIGTALIVLSALAILSLITGYLAGWFKGCKQKEKDLEKQRVPPS